MRDLTQHLTTRADDNHAPPGSLLLFKKGAITDRSRGCQDLVRFFALLRIKPHAPPLVRVPVNSFEFLFLRTYPGNTYWCLLRHRALMCPGHLVSSFTAWTTRYRILFALTLEPQCQLQSSKPPLVFLLISTHFTATPGIPPCPPAL